MNKGNQYLTIALFITINAFANSAYAGQWIQSGTDTRVAKSKQEIADLMATTQSLDYLNKNS